MGRRGTHTGPAFSDFLIGGLPAATGRKMHFTGTTVLKVIDGKIVEETHINSSRLSKHLPPIPIPGWCGQSLRSAGSDLTPNECLIGWITRVAPRPPRFAIRREPAPVLDRTEAT